MKPANSILAGFGTTVFEVMTRLAMEHQTINLGQGFPDQDGPDSIKAMVDRATKEGPNQYPPMLGISELRQAVAAHGKRFYDLDVDWQTQVMVTSGATEALAASILALIEPGDEAVVFEPLYDSYVPMLRRAGAEVKLVRLQPPRWELPRDELAGSIRQVAFPEAQVLQRRTVRAGETVGYNATWTAKRDTAVAILNLGYADGYFRAFSDSGTAEGGALPVIGRVSMDLVAMDVCARPDVAEGDWIAIDFALPTAAKQSGMSQYELLTSLGRRFERECTGVA